MSDETEGYRELTDLEVGAINDIKALENRIGTLVATLREPSFGVDVDPRWMAIGVTDLQKGFMALTRAVEKPESKLK